LNEEKRKRNKFFSIFPLKHWGVKKETRIRWLIPRYESKSVFHVWDCHDLEDEMRVFPRWHKDDCIDSLGYIEQIAYVPSAAKNWFIPISQTPSYKKNMLTGVISYS
jgi:hypothetical protein